MLLFRTAVTLAITRTFLVALHFVPSNAETFPHEVTRRGTSIKSVTRAIAVVRRCTGVFFSALW